MRCCYCCWLVLGWSPMGNTLLLAQKRNRKTQTDRRHTEDIPLKYTRLTCERQTAPYLIPASHSEYTVYIYCTQAKSRHLYFAHSVRSRSGYGDWMARMWLGECVCMLKIWPIQRLNNIHIVNAQFSESDSIFVFPQIIANSMHTYRLLF